MCTPHKHCIKPYHNSASITVKGMLSNLFPTNSKGQKHDTSRLGNFFFP